MSALSILAEECELLNDSKYRSYITQIEKALKSFDSTSEWADLISALGKLNKVLLGHVKYSVIPKRVTIGKRLAQCLHPALPSGVHMKALETYDIIFKCIGTERLAQDLFIYSAGLFPLLSHAAMNVKPTLLMIYEKHFVNLRQRIKPGLNGLLLGLLPGLEEGSEFYDRTNALLEDFAEGTELSYFYTCLWECIHSCPSVRLPATVYLLTHFNKKQSMEDQLHMIGLNINLMIEAICSAVQDTSVLVQRSMLDFLLFAFPLHNSQLTHSDMAKVVKYAINVLLRRDMSLNRRFYAWLLGTSTTLAAAHAESSELTELSYFEKYSQDLLIQALKYKLTERLDSQSSGSSSMKSTMLRPFRILISLLDKPEIGPIILESVLLSIFRCLHREFELSTSKSPAQSSKKTTKGDTNAYDELLKTANLLFGTFEPYFIWDYAARMFDQSCSNSGKRALRRTSSSVSRHSGTHEECVGVGELCQLVAFLLDIVSLETFSETQTEHLPNLLCSIITSLTTYCDKLSDSDVITSLQLCTKILSKVQPTMTTSGSHDLSCDESPDVVDKVEVSGSGEITSQKAEVVEPMSVEEALEMNRNLKMEELKKDSNGRSAEEIEVDTPGSATSSGSMTGSTSSNSESDVMNKNGKPVKKNETGSNTSGTGVQSRKHSKQNQSTNLMQKCIDCFQEFFHELVTQKFLKDGKMSETCFVNILNSHPGFENYDSAEEDLFSTCDNKDSSNCDRKIILENESEDSSTTFSTACQLLVEFASFPMYGEDTRSLEKQILKESATIPLWVKDLVTCCCFVHNFHMQSSAVSTMLDLIILTQSVQVEHRPDNSGNQTGSGHMTVQILPTLHWEDLKFLSEHTNFFKVAAEILWGFLNEQTPEYHQSTVKLFYMLHQVAPSSWICENVIGNQLIHETQSVQTDAYKKFSVLWHLTRNKKTDVIPGKPLRTFNRSMFVILDSLKDETSPLKVIATTWLTHVIQQGDINRVMEPVLQMLLHPDTARVSVQHVNVHQPRKVCLSESSEENLEANIYAISSEGGNVIYHVSSPKEAPKKQFSDELKSYALTVLGEKGAHTAPVRTRSEQELHFDKVDPTSVSLRINPFGSENSLDGLALDLGLTPSLKDSTVNKAKRLDKETCAKEGISFTETEESHKGETTGDDTDGNDSVSDSAENIAMNIIDEILKNVTKGSESTTSSTESLKDVVKPQKKKLPERADSISSFTAADELLNSVQRQRVDSPTPSEKDIAMFQEIEKDSTNIHTLHMHMLLYIQKYDYQRTLYALSTLKAMLVACPRNMVTALITTNISTLRSTQLAKLQLLLARHRKSVFGKNFFGEIPAEVMSNYRSSMFIEILISVCLYFLRGYYPNLMMSKMSYEELLGNKQVHILATETLTLMMSEIVSLMRDSGKKLGLGSYISDLLQRCKVQKALLHCILAEIYNGRRKVDKDQFGQKITEAIIAFNEDRIDPSANEAFQIKLLDLLLVMIMLEEQIGKYQSLPESTPTSEWDRLKVNYQPSLKNVRYNLGHPIMQQGMFVSGVLSALKQTHSSHMHRHWVAMVTSALPYMGKYLPGIVMTVVSQLCRNIEALAAQYESDGKSSSSRYEKIPPDHVLTMLSGLMTLCHYCLLDNMSPVSIGQQAPSNSGSSTTSTTVNTNILTNLFHVFNPVGGSKEASPQRDVGAMSPVLEARNSILSVMPRIIACMAALWRAINVVEKQEESPVLTMGSPKVVRQYILEFISPISLPHGLHLLGAIAVAWNDRRKRTAVKNSRKVLPTPCEDQLLLVDLVGAIKVFPTDTLVQTVKEVLNNPPSSELSRTKKGIPLEVNMLQFFYAYVQRTSANQLIDSWSSLSSLLKESLQLGLVAPGQFLLLLILNEFVQKTPSMVDKKKREIQEIAQKLLEAVSNIAGSSLEQTTWLRKNYAVKPGPQSDEPEEGNQPDDDSVVMEKRVVELEPTSVNTADSKYSVQALAALAEITAPLLDVIYTSDEKDKVSPFLTTLLYNIFPYLKSHNMNNLPSLRVASQFLSSISSYQYTRKAWRREALDLLLDSSFFQMDMESIGYWVTIVDNLMTHDKTTYKDLMARVSMAQTGSLNLFSNKEQEIDQKAGMLKRLAFTVYCSEADQYQKSIPEIQEKLAESLRILQAPSVMAQVFLCFRVLMMRVSPQHLTSMWPTIITELIHVFLQIEQELSTETEEFVTQVQRIAALDSSWAHLGNGLNAHNNPSWMQLYLSACKLLDMCLALPADNVPQFQLYRWAFIGGAAAGEGEDDISEEERKKKDPRGKQKQFKPHIIRLAKLLNNKLKGDIPMMKMVPGRPLLTFTHLRSLQELQPFFNTLCLANQTDNLLLAARQLGASGSHNQSNVLTNGHAGMKTSLQLETKDLIGRGMPKSKSTPSFPVSQSSKSETAVTDSKSSQQFIEEVLMRDFLEPMS